MKSLSRTIGIPRLALSVVAVLLVSASFAFATGGFFGPFFKISVDPANFDPSRTKLVAAQWIGGIGCPTAAKQVLFDFNPPYDLLPPSTFTDAGCPTGDIKDKGNEGLLFVKTGETLNNASATATIKGVTGIVLSQIGYDLRGGSWCGAGAPRFNIKTLPTVANPAGKSYFLGCSSPAPTSSTPSSSAFTRLAWGDGTPGSVPAYLNGSTLENITDRIKSISMIFDEAQYFTLDIIPPTPDPYGNGLAVLDNISVSGTLYSIPVSAVVGRDNDNDHRYFHHDW